MRKPKDWPLLAARVVTAFFIGASGAAKLAGVPYVHGSFAELGLPVWFGYFIGACEVLGSIALFVRPLRALAALGLLVIMIGAIYYHANFTPIVQAVPAFVLALLCIYIFLENRREILRFDRA